MLSVLPASFMFIAAAAGFMPPGKAPATHDLCKPHQHIVTTSRAGGHFIVKNDNYGDELECLTNRNKWSNFRVAKSGATIGHIEPVAYPDIFLGCSWGLCSPHSGLPKRVDRLHAPVTSWYTTQRAKGQWSVGYDIWFNRTRSVAGQDDGAELMIWLNSKGFSPNTWPVVEIDHVRWHLAHWVTGGHGKRWNYIQFRRVRPTTHVQKLGLTPFIRVAEHYGFIKPQWWLTSVEAGFEIWRGGVGLGTARFWARA